MQKTFTYQLITARNKRQMLIKEVAIALGVDASLVSKFESGKRLPTKKQVFLLASILKIDADELMISWMSEQIISQYGDDNLALEAFKVAEQRVAYTIEQRKNAVPSSINKMLLEIDKFKKVLDNLRATSSYKIAEALELEYTYESNKIEGNTLTLQETNLVINKGLTISGKTMQEHLEAINHKEAIAFVKELVSKQALLTERLVLQIHNLILRGIDSPNAGKYRNVSVMISGSTHLPPAPYIIPKQMEDLFFWYGESRNTMHPIILAAEMHERLVTIHPFIDGNGRTSRLLMNLILIQNGYVIANIKGDITNRLKYYEALESVRRDKNKEKFIAFIAKTELECMKRLVKILQGEC